MASTRTKDISTTAGQRISALEMGYERLREDVHELGRSFERSSEETRRAITSLAEKVTTSQRTPWGVLASWAAVVLTAVALTGGLIASSINSSVSFVDARSLDNAKTVTAHLLDGHPQSIKDQMVYLRDLLLEREGHDKELVMALIKQLTERIAKMEDRLTTK